MSASNFVAGTLLKAADLNNAINAKLDLGGGTMTGPLAATLLSVQRHAVNDAAYAVAASDSIVAYTAITAARIVTLRAANSYAAGTQIEIVDESGACSTTNTITATAAGADTINAATSSVIASPYGGVALESDGVSKWTVVYQAYGDLGAAWTAYTPSVSSGTGTLTTTSSTGRYRKIGRVVCVQMTVTITTNGSGATSIIAGLPFQANTVSPFELCGKERGVSNKMLQGDIAASATTATITVFDNTYPGASGASIVISGIYESAA